MAIKQSTSRVYTCDVKGCPSRVTVESDEAVEPLPDDALPKGWHIHGLPMITKDGASWEPREIHCDKHWYRFQPIGDFFEAVPRVKRPRKGGSGSGGRTE